jgi:hypothetical protein
MATVDIHEERRRRRRAGDPRVMTSPLWWTRWTPLVLPSSVHRSRTTESRRARRRQAPWRAWISRGWRHAVANRPRSVASDLAFRVGLPGFEPGTS